MSADLLQNDYAGDLILALNKAEIAYRVDVNPVTAASVCWERQVSSALVSHYSSIYFLFCDACDYYV